MDKGVLYIVSSNKEIIEECIHSAASVKRYNPRLPVQVISQAPSSRFRKKYFDFVDIRPDAPHPLKAKVRFLTESRFEKTLFLDADTEVRMSLEHLFETTSGMQFAMTFDNRCDWSASPVKFLSQESRDINTGFLVYDKSEEVAGQFRKWNALISAQDESDMRPGHNCDQVYFNRHLRDTILSSSEIKTGILPNTIYNVRPWCWEHLRQTGQFSKAGVLHAHHLHHGFFRKLLRKAGALLSAKQIRSPAFP